MKTLVSFSLVQKDPAYVVQHRGALLLSDVLDTCSSTTCIALFDNLHSEKNWLLLCLVPVDQMIYFVVFIQDHPNAFHTLYPVVVACQNCFNAQKDELRTTLSYISYKNTMYYFTIKCACQIISYPNQLTNIVNTLNNKHSGNS